MIAADVQIVGNDHLINSLSAPVRLAFGPEPPTTVIGADVWIGQRAMIRAGVTIGRGAIIGAGSIVLHNVSPFTIVAGAPAKVIRARFSEMDRQLIESKMFG